MWRAASRCALLARAAKAAVVVSVGLGGLTSPGSAQVIPTEGTRVRFSTDSVDMRRWTVGQFIASNDQALRLVALSGDTLNVPRPAIYHFQVSEGRHAHPKMGAMLGAGAGAATAFIVRAVGCSRERDPYWRGHTSGQQEDCARWPVFPVTAIGALGGALLGAFIGQVAKSDRWIPVTVERFPR